MVKMKISELNKLIENTYFQKFKIEDNLNIVPDERAVNDLKYIFNIFPLEKTKGKRVLDIGCNHGLYSIYMKMRGQARYVLGIDPFPDAINLAKEIAKELKLNIDFQCKRFFDDILTHKKFDIILCVSVYHYLFRDYKSHDRIFQILYQMCDEMYWENPLDVSDYSCNEMFDHYMPNEKENYTKEKILDAAEKFFDIKYIGTHINKTRHIYHMRKKKREKENYIELETLFYNDESKTKITKVEIGNNIYALKKIYEPEKDLTEVSEHIFNRSYKEYYPILKRKINEFVKIYDTWILEGNERYFCCLMEYLDGYKSVAHADSDKELNEKEKIKIFNKMCFILSKLYTLGYHIVDPGPENFMIDLETFDVKMIDLDKIYKTEDLEPFHIERCYKYLSRTIQWLTDVSTVRL